MFRRKVKSLLESDTTLLRDFVSEEMQTLIASMRARTPTVIAEELERIRVFFQTIEEERGGTLVVASLGGGGRDASNSVGVNIEERLERLKSAVDLLRYKPVCCVVCADLIVTE